MCKLTKHMSKFNIFTQILQGHACFLEKIILHSRDGRDKFQVWAHAAPGLKVDT